MDRSRAPRFDMTYSNLGSLVLSTLVCRTWRMFYSASTSGVILGGSRVWRRERCVRCSLTWPKLPRPLRRCSGKLILRLFSGECRTTPLNVIVGP